MSFKLPDDWLWLPFGKILSEPLRNGIYKKKEFHGRGCKIINMGELFGYPRLKEGVEMKRVELNERELGKSTLKNGDLIFARRSLTAEGAGKCSIILSLDEPTTFESSIIRARLDLEIANPEYYYYLFNSPFGKWLLGTILRQVAVSGITGSDLAKLEVPVPPKDIQDKLVVTGVILDDKIELNRGTNKTLEDIAQAVFRSWFVDFDPTRAKIVAIENGQDPELAAMGAISGKSIGEINKLSLEQQELLKTTSALFPDALVDSELGEIPEGWCVKKIAECVERLPVGKKFTQKTSRETGKIPVLDQGKSGIIGYHDEKPGVEASPDNPIIVFANHTCYMRLIMHDFSTIQNVLPFKGVDLDIFWIYQATYGKQEFIEYKGHWPDFSIKEIVVPRNDLDGIFGEFIKLFYVKMFNNEKEIEGLCNLRDTLLPKLLSGEIEVQKDI